VSDVSWQTNVRPTVEELLRTSDVPGIIIAAARGAGDPDFLIIGEDGAGRPLAADSLFPVASITKLAAALAVFRLVDDGKFALDDPLARHVPDAESAREGPTIRDLLRHTGGLPVDVAAEAAPYTPALDWPTLRNACLATPIIEPVGKQIRYSNTGVGLLAIVVERTTGKTFPEAVTDLVLSPLGVEGYLCADPPRSPARIAGDYGQHAGTELEPFNSAFWRSLALPWGGMVSTAAGALALARVFAGLPRGFLPASLLAEATRDQTGDLAGTMLGLPFPPSPWGLGVELHGTKDPHWVPKETSPGSFGHAGASGCLVWVDPAADIAWALLGPRTFDAWWLSWAPIGSAILASAR
jgi:CubicO group peptidase (beta-lactamase class C family)